METRKDDTEVTRAKPRMMLALALIVNGFLILCLALYFIAGWLVATPYHYYADGKAAEQILTSPIFLFGPFVLLALVLGGIYLYRGTMAREGKGVAQLYTIIYFLIALAWFMLPVWAFQLSKLSAFLGYPSAAEFLELKRYHLMYAALPIIAVVYFFVRLRRFIRIYLLKR